ncbi:heme biosynthesis HemY N-terminal domain-containing protein [Aquicella lusitana]|uniref:HemY protein n=1 Tax=Aquicella lusitana TaxID=254246 RepID=A0A370G3Q3_9COXI|nr:heme biosynthesis HemY N-terminal domain-containing protein [Aquicella lusitana]RDI38372.1 HemY protein [Aquicella lusitana]VVC72385.1 hypothetical protein AQULUS_00950 [Aquicella lusitana]
MRRLILFLLFLIASVWVGIKLIHNPGYLLMVYQPWMIQMPLWFALLSLIIVFILFYLLIDSIDRLQFLWFRMKNWLRLRREHRSYSKTQQGLVKLIEGRWKKAENLLLSGATQSLEPLMNYLGAAKAAHELGAYDRRDRYIQKAYHLAPEADLAIGLTQAELALAQDQLEQAQATLNHLRQLSPHHPRILQLLEKVYVRLADWQNLLALLPALRKAKVLNAEQAVLFEKNIYCEILQAAYPKTRAELRAIWDNVPKAMKKNPDVVCAYVKGLLLEQNRFQANTLPDEETAREVEELIRRTLKYQWQPELAHLYGTLPFTNLNRQLVIAGAWLKLYGQKPELLLLLGKLCTQVQLWGKAKDYFQKCLNLSPNADASLAYGKLLEQLGETEEAMQKYREGLVQLASRVE